jgi:hypothetical protein
LLGVLRVLGRHRVVSVVAKQVRWGGANGWLLCVLMKALICALAANQVRMRCWGCCVCWAASHLRWCSVCVWSWAANRGRWCGVACAPSPQHHLTHASHLPQHQPTTGGGVQERGGEEDQQGALGEEARCVPLPARINQLYCVWSCVCVCVSVCVCVCP